MENIGNTEGGDAGHKGTGSGSKTVKTNTNKPASAEDGDAEHKGTGSGTKTANVGGGIGGTKGTGSAG